MQTDYIFELEKYKDYLEKTKKKFNIVVCEKSYYEYIFDFQITDLVIDRYRKYLFDSIELFVDKIEY